jgi:UPF0716 protein FxsA
MQHRRKKAQAAMRIGLGVIFIVFPLVELALLIRAGQLIGVWPTLGIVVITAAIGGIILHQQGYSTMSRAVQAVEEGEPPVEPVVDGAFLVLAGALLIAPGLITDAVGFLLLISPVRRVVGQWCLNTLLASPNVHVRVFTRRGQRRRAGDAWSSKPGEAGPVIEGEFEELDEKPPRRTLGGSRDRSEER